MVAPGVDDATILKSRVARAGVTTALLPHEWARAAAGVDVVIGTRTAVFARLPKLGSIMVVDEHDERLQSEASPTWHARDVAGERARRSNIPLILVSATPTPEALHERAIEAPSREREIAGWPEIVIADLSNTDSAPGGRLSSVVIEELRNPSRRVLCVVNRKGTSKLLACRSCRELATCERCESVMSQPSDDLLSCAKCGSERPMTCLNCHGMSFLNLRPGAARLVKELAAAAGRPARVVDAGTEPAWSSGPEVDVLVGTEAVLHRVTHADTVVILDIDSEVSAPRFRAGEQTLSFLARAARLVGRKADGGRLIVQTRQVDHPLLAAMSQVAPGDATELERYQREQLGLPPYGAIAVIEGAGAADFVQSLPDSVRVGGNGDRRQVRATAPDVLGEALAMGQRPAKGRLRVAVNPSR